MVKIKQHMVKVHMMKQYVYGKKVYDESVYAEGLYGERGYVPAVYCKGVYKGNNKKGGGRKASGSKDDGYAKCGGLCDIFANSFNSLAIRINHISNYPFAVLVQCKDRYEALLRYENFYLKKKK
eukprot:398129_1